MNTFKSLKCLVFICFSFSFIVCFLIGFVCYSLLRTHDDIDNVADSIELTGPISIKDQDQAEDYKKVLNQIIKIKNEILDLDHYSKLVLSQGNTQPKINFNDLSELEKRVLLMELADGFTKKTTEIAKMWQAEIDIGQFKNDDYEKELLNLRKEFAALYEDFVEKTFEQFEQEISEKERIKTLNEIKTLHEKLGLIKR